MSQIFVVKILFCIKTHITTIASFFLISIRFGYFGLILQYFINVDSKLQLDLATRLEVHENVVVIVSHERRNPSMRKPEINKCIFSLLSLFCNK